MWLQVSTKAVNAIRTVTAVASCHPNFHADTFLGCISSYIKMWHPTIIDKLGWINSFFSPKNTKDCGSKTVATFGGVEVLLKLATFACQGAQAGSTSEGGDAHSTPPLQDGQMSILRVFLGVALTSDFFF